MASDFPRAELRQNEEQATNQRKKPVAELGASKNPSGPYKRLNMRI
jgi:hypothetical protein